MRESFPGGRRWRDLKPDRVNDWRTRPGNDGCRILGAEETNKTGRRLTNTFRRRLPTKTGRRSASKRARRVTNETTPPPSPGDIGWLRTLRGPWISAPDPYCPNSRRSARSTRVSREPRCAKDSRQLRKGPHPPTRGAGAKRGRGCATIASTYGA